MKDVPYRHIEICPGEWAVKVPDAGHAPFVVDVEAGAVTSPVP